MKINDVTADQVGRIVAWMQQTNASATAFFDGENLFIDDEFAPLAESVIADGIPANDPTSVLKPYASNVRWQKEVSGIVVSGVSVSTDDRSKQMITGARLAAEANPEFTTPWVGADGSITTLNATQVIAISDAVLSHVQSCFATFSKVSSAIDAQTITTREQIDAAFAA